VQVCLSTEELADRALAPSTMKSGGTAGSSPRLTRLSMSAYGRGVLRRTLDEAERMFVALGIDTNCREEDRNISLWQPNRTVELAGRDIDQHLVHGPLADPVLGNRHLPARQSLLLALEVAKPWSFDLGLAAVEADQDQTMFIWMLDKLRWSAVISPRPTGLFIA